MRIHCVALPHTDVTPDFDWCAYTGKLRRFPIMLAAHGHQAIVYGAEHSDVEIVTMSDRQRWFGRSEWDRERVFDRWNPGDPCWRIMGARAASEIVERWEPGDLLGLIMGRCQEITANMVRAAIPNAVVVEWGVGYDGILSNSHCAFESQAWRHHVYGLRGIADGRNFDTVIPNAFLLEELTRAESDGYLLFLGRHTERKGLEVVRELAARFEVVTAGQDGPLLDKEGAGIPYEGVVTGDEKAKLIAGARAVLTPTQYLEPFGGVAVEAMLSGVPVISSDHGAFTETVTQGVTGFRCNTLQDYLDAVDAVERLDRDLIAKVAAARYSTEAVAPLYSNWLERLGLLYRAGWYQS